MSDIAKALSDLINSGQDLTQNTHLPAQTLQTYDLYPFFVNNFTDKAVKVLNTKTYNLVYEWNELIPGKHIQTYSLVCMLNKWLKTADYLVLDKCYPVQRHFAPCRYFGIATTQNEIAQGAMKLVNLINDLAEKDYIVATLAPLLFVKLDDGKIIVLTYICIRDTGAQYVDTMYKNYYEITEDGTPKTLQEIP